MIAADLRIGHRIRLIDLLSAIGRLHGLLAAHTPVIGIVLMTGVFCCQTLTLKFKLLVYILPQGGVYLPGKWGKVGRSGELEPDF